MKCDSKESQEGVAGSGEIKDITNHDQEDRKLRKEGSPVDKKKEGSSSKIRNDDNPSDQDSGSMRKDKDEIEADARKEGISIQDQEANDRIQEEAKETL